MVLKFRRNLQVLDAASTKIHADKDCFRILSHFGYTFKTNFSVIHLVFF